jgi:hypothetical protein
MERVKMNKDNKFNFCNWLLASLLISGCLEVQAASNVVQGSRATTIVSQGSSVGHTMFCTEQQLANFKAQILNSLSTIETDTDFSFAVVAEDGREIRYDRGESRMTTVYESASTSKWPTATIILSFMESAANQASHGTNRLTLDSKPQDFFGLNSEQWPIEATDSLANLTLRDLLSFTSGLTTEPTCITPGNGMITMETCVRNIALQNKENGNIPGKVFYYNGNHLQVAGLMAVAARNLALNVTNSTWHDLFSDFKSKTNLFANATYDLPSTSNPRLGGGMHWTGNEYLAFIKANYFNQVLSSSKMPGEAGPYWQLQRADQIADAIIRSSPAINRIGEDWHYGLGLWLQCHNSSFSNCAPVSGAPSNSLTVGNVSSVSSWAAPGAFGAFPFMDVGNKFYGIIARQGEKGTFNKGYAVFEPVSYTVQKWAKKDCSN